MIFDTDILIWIERGNSKAARLIEKDDDRSLSIQSYMELLQGAKNKLQHRYVKDFSSEFEFTILPLTENIGYRAFDLCGGACPFIKYESRGHTDRGYGY